MPRISLRETALFQFGRMSLLKRDIRLTGEDGKPSGYTITGDNDFEMGFFYTKNLQGDITGIADANGNTVTTYTYDAWGKIISVTGTEASTIGSTNPFRYRGYYYDTETELYYLQSRYYNPEWGRFINSDDFQQLMRNYSVLSATHMCNLFAYCENNPINFLDAVGSASYGCTYYPLRNPAGGWQITYLYHRHT